MRARFAFVVALIALTSVIAGAPTGDGTAGDNGALLWVGNPFVAIAHAQEPAEPTPVEESQPEPEPVEPPEGAAPIEEVQEPAGEAEGEPAPEPEPQPEAAVEPEPAPEPAPEPEPVTLGDVYSALIAAETAQAANQVTVDASTEALDAARQSLIDAELAHATAMEGQGEHNAGVRGAAQALVDYLTATYLQE